MIDTALISILTANSAINAIVAGRIYNQILPQNPTLPAIVISKISAIRDLSHSGSTGIVDARFQFSCFAESVAAVKQLAALVAKFFHGYSGSSGGETILLCETLNEVDLFDVDLFEYQVAIDVSVKFRE